MQIFAITHKPCKYAQSLCIVFQKYIELVIQVNITCRKIIQIFILQDLDKNFSKTMGRRIIKSHLSIMRK